MLAEWGQEIIFPTTVLHLVLLNVKRANELIVLFITKYI